MFAVFIWFLIFFNAVFSNSLADTAKNQGIFEVHDRTNGIKTIKAHSIGSDNRFKSFPFVPKAVYELIALYDNPTMVEFEADEIITTIVSTNREAWQLSPQRNKLYIKPLESNADMYLTVATTKRKYHFQMLAEEPKPLRTATGKAIKGLAKDYTFSYQFKYPTEGQGSSIKKYAKSVLPDIDKHPEKYNFYYTMIGEKSIYPIKIFDDGEFTYFEFPKNSRIPAVFSVDSNGFESIINFRMVGDYLVVEEASPRFTLRNGPDVVCVYNELLYQARDVKQSYAKGDVDIVPSVPPQRKPLNAGVGTGKSQNEQMLLKARKASEAILSEKNINKTTEVVNEKYRKAAAMFPKEQIVYQSDSFRRNY